VVVTGVGHLMYLEKPREFTELVASFVENTS
jgi:pimeloyl-ACP methyl ester carboxylesterase